MRQETGAGPCQRSGNGSNPGFSRIEICHGKRQCGNAAQTGAQAVHVVEEVERVGDPDHPECGEYDDRCRRKRKEESEPDSKISQGQPGCGRRRELPKELELRPQSPHIVHESGGQNHQATDTQRRDAGKRSPAREREKRHRSEQRPDRHGQTAEKRSGGLVPFVSAGSIYD